MRLISPRADYTIKYRYYRIRQKASVWSKVSQYAVSVYELRLYSHPNQTGTEFALSGTGIAMDSYAGFPASYINNNNLSDRWVALYTTSTYKWFGIDSGSSAKYPLRSIAMYVPADSDGLQFPQYAAIEGSDDNTTWYCIGVFQTSNITAPQWLYYNITRAAFLEVQSGTAPTFSYPRMISFTATNNTTCVLRLGCKLSGKKAYFEIISTWTGGDIRNTSFSINNSAPFGGSFGTFSIAVDYDARCFWVAYNAAVDTSGTPYATFTPTDVPTISVYPYPLLSGTWRCDFNFGHYPDTPFTYAAPAGFERIQV